MSGHWIASLLVGASVIASAQLFLHQTAANQCRALVALYGERTELLRKATEQGLPIDSFAGGRLNPLWDKLDILSLVPPEQGGLDQETIRLVHACRRRPGWSFDRAELDREVPGLAPAYEAGLLDTEGFATFSSTDPGLMSGLMLKYPQALRTGDGPLHPLASPPVLLEAARKAGAQSLIGEETGIRAWSLDGPTQTLRIQCRLFGGKWRVESFTFERKEAYGEK